jgi:hypothetical protein
MSIQETMIAALEADAGVQALVSSGSPLEHRIYAAPAAEGTARPYISYQVITDASFNRLAGAPCNRRKLLQVNCWADSHATADALGDAVRAALNTIAHQTGGGMTYDSDSQVHRAYFDFAFIE